MQADKNRTTLVYSVPPGNQWGDREDEPGGFGVPTGVHIILTNRMGINVTYRTISDQ